MWECLYLAQRVAESRLLVNYIELIPNQICCIETTPKYMYAAKMYADMAKPKT